MAFLAVLVIQCPVSAQEIRKIVLYPTDAAYVDMIAPDVNFGSSPVLELSWSVVTPAGGAGENVQVGRFAYLKFNVSTLEGSTIRSAFLKLYVSDAAIGSGVITVLPERNTTWSESAITSNSAPDVPASISEVRDRAISEVNVTEGKTWYSLNVTSYVRSVHSGFLSFMVVGGNTQPPFSAPIKINSNASGDPGLRPCLEVTYSGALVGFVNLTLRSSVAGGSVYFNGTEYKTSNSLGVVLEVPVGHYVISASPTISTSEGARGVFQKWNDDSLDNPREVSVNRSVTLEAEYIQQYYLNATTQYGFTTGTGWFGAGSTATVEVSGEPGSNPPRVKDDGALGLLGVSYVFDHWSGYPENIASLQVTVDSPLTVTAIWRQDYRLFYSYVILAGIVLGAGSVAAIILGRVSGAPRRKGMKRNRLSDLTRTSRRPGEYPPSLSRTDAVSLAPRETQFTREAKPARGPASGAIATVANSSQVTKVEDQMAMEESAVIEARELSKAFGSVVAVDKVSFKIRRGELFSFLGPNGAGKTTILRLLSCTLKPSGGSAWVLGYDVRTDSLRVRRSIGVIPQWPSLYTDLSAVENFNFFAKLQGVRGRELDALRPQLLSLVELNGREKELVGTYSGGMMRRLSIACALVHRPPIVFFDEPTSGLDPQTKRTIWKLMKNLTSSGVTVILSTHYMEEADRLSDRVAIIDHGKVIAIGTTDSLKEMAQLGTTSETTLEDVFIELTGKQLREQ